VAKLTLSNVVSGFASTTTTNANNDLIEAALENTLSRNGTSPNTMNADIDMNGHAVINYISTFGEVGFTYLNDWATGTSYAINNLVYVPIGTGSTYDGFALICRAAHTSGTLNTDYTAGRWRILAARGASGAGSGDMLKSENLSGLSSIVVARTNLGLTIGTNVEAFNADILKANVADVIVAGFALTPYSAGTKSSGTYTPDEANGNMQYYINGGAHTLAPPTNNSTLVLQCTNNASAGTITTSGFTVVDGDTLTTINADDFIFYITKINGFSHLTVKALQ